MTYYQHICAPFPLPQVRTISVGDSTPNCIFFTGRTSAFEFENIVSIPAGVEDAAFNQGGGNRRMITNTQRRYTYS